MSARYCEKCQKDLTDNERNLEAVAGDCLCVQCRSDSSWHIKEQKYADFIAACPALESLCEALVPNQLCTWEMDSDFFDTPSLLVLNQGMLRVVFDASDKEMRFGRKCFKTGSIDWGCTFDANTPPPVILGAISAALATGEHESKI